MTTRYFDEIISGAAKFGDDGVTNYAAIAADGEHTLFGTGRVRKEIEIPLTNLAVGASGVTVATIGNYVGYSFDISDDMHAVFEVPHDWAVGTDLAVKLYWAIDEAFGAGVEVQWQIVWAACPTDASEALDAPTHTGTIDFGDQNVPATAKFLTKTPAGAIAAASLSEGDMVALVLSRVALDGGSNPTADPVGFRIEIDYLSDRLGEAT